MMLACPGLQKV